MLRLVPFLAALLTLPVVAAEPVDLSVPEMTDWDGEAPEQVFVAGDLTMTLTVTGDPAERVATLRVEKPGMAAVDVSALGSGLGFGQVGVFPFDESGGRTVLFAVYAGGAHCCMQIRAVTEVGDTLVTDEVATVDGDSIAPEDIDGDGIYELPLFDGRFNYSFDAYAFSFPPKEIYKSKDGLSYDASRDPRWHDYFAGQVEERRGECSGDTWNLGGCAGMLGAAARIGTFDTELAPVTAAIKAGKTTSGWGDFDICGDALCNSRAKTSDFSVAVRALLEEWNYL